MGKALNIFKWGISLGKEPQNFLGAGWIPGFLRRVSKKRKWALRILSLSPHYFFDGDDPKFAKMTTDEFLEFASERATQERVSIFEEIFAPEVSQEMTILEYGCGPGYLAKAASAKANKVFACDISAGALACAEIINGAGNIEYLKVLENGLDAIPNQSLDAVYSFAVIQHLTDEVYETVIQNCAAKLKPGGKLLMHVMLEDETWRTEEDWKSDRSIQGRIKYKYGLHCFARSKAQHEAIISKHDFEGIEFFEITKMGVSKPEDFGSQSLLKARRKS